MKKNLALLLVCGAIVTWSCNNDADNNTTNDSPSTITPVTTDTNSTTNNNNVNAAPLNEADQMFVKDAATVDMMEIEAANIANTNAESQRVKDYAAMMIRDHTANSNELKSYVAGRVDMPTALPDKDMKHMEEMKKMKGKAFDNHYMKMMTDDHSKVIAKFEKASNTASDTGLKEWAKGKLPVLKMHLDSAKAIRKM